MKSLWTRHSGDRIAADLESAAGDPEFTPWAKWGMGVAAPLACLVVGIRMIVRRAGVLPGENGESMALYGTDAVLLGWAIVCIAALLHTRNFWGNSMRLYRFQQAGMALSLLGFCTCAVWLVIRLAQSVF